MSAVQRDTSSELATVALSSFRARPVHPVRRVMGLLVRGRVETWLDPQTAGEPAYRAIEARGEIPRIADPAIAAQADGLGLRYAGIAVERGLLRRIRKDVWLDPECIVQLHSRRRPIRDHAPRSVYHLSTYFSDGSCVLTWSHPPQTPSDDALASRGGSGQLSRDLEEHRAAVVAWSAERDTRPLAIDGPEAVSGLIDHYYRQLVPKSLAVSFLAGLVSIGILVAWVGGLVWRIFR
jgi:hypothetical protein